MSYVIEEHIPLPETKRGGNWKGAKSEWTQTLERLMPGQSVLTTEYREFKAASAAVFRRPDAKFAIRKIAGQGWRVWRVA